MWCKNIQLVMGRYGSVARLHNIDLDHRTIRHTLDRSNYNSTLGFTIDFVDYLPYLYNDRLLYTDSKHHSRSL